MKLGPTSESRVSIRSPPKQSWCFTDFFLISSSFSNSCIYSRILKLEITFLLLAQNCSSFMNSTQVFRIHVTIIFPFIIVSFSASYHLLFPLLPIFVSCILFYFPFLVFPVFFRRFIYFLRRMKFQF